MKAVASKIVRKKRGDLKAIAASQITEPVIAREYQAIFKSNGKPMVIIDHDTTISLANAEFERLSGYTKKEIEGTKKWAEFVAQEDRKRMKEYHLLRKSDPMLAPRCCEFRFVDRHGKIKNIVLTIGQITGTNKSMASLQDVTDRRGAEITQRADEERYQTFFENSRDAVYITTGDGSYVDANCAALDLFGYTREEMKKMKARQLYADPADARRLRKEIEKKGFAQDFEVRLRKKDATQMDCLFTVTALRGDDGSILEYQGIARDVTERKRAVEALRKSEEKYRAIFDSMLEGYFEIDLAGNFTFFNQPVSKFFGYPRDELMGLNYQKYTSPEEQQRLFQVFNEIYKTGNPHEIGAYEIIKKDGSIGIATFSVSLLRNAAGEPIGFSGVTRDMTEKKQTEARLQQSEENYRKILEMAPEGIAINRLKDERNVLVNDAFCRHTGYRREEIIGRSALELNLFCDRADHKRFAKTLRKEGRVEGLEINFWAKDGTILNDLVSARPIRFKGEDCLLVVATNINALKKAEEALRESEERYRSIIEDTEASYFETDLGGNYTFVNDAECKMLGYTREELIGMNYRQLSHETIAKKIYHFFNETYKTGKPIKLMDQEITRKNGTKLIAEVSASLIRDSEGQPIGFRGIARDISKRTQAEEAMRLSEEKYRTILETMQEAYYEIDLAGKYIFVNEAFYEHLGYTKEELIGTKSRQYQDETTAREFYEAYSRLYRTGEPIRAIGGVWINKNGTKRTYELSASLMRDPEGKPIGFRGVSRDITERKQMEEALRQSEEKYRTIIETMQEGFFEIDLKGSYTFANEALCKRQGYSKEELIGMNNRQFQDETNAQKAYQAFHEVYRTGEPNKFFEMEVIKKDGTKGISEVSVSLIRDAQGKPIGYRGVSHDITERKRAEEVLRQSEEKYRTIIKTIQEGYFETDLAGIFTFVNDAQCKITGTPREQLLGKNNRDYTSEEEAKRLYQIYNRIYRTGEPEKGYAFEFTKRDGTKAFHEVSASLMRDAEGKPIGFRGISRDVTERKLAEKTLRERQEELQTLMDASPIGICWADVQGNIQYNNRKFRELFGYTIEDIPNIATWRTLAYPDPAYRETIPSLIDLLTEAQKQGKDPTPIEVNITCKDGSTRRVIQAGTFVSNRILTIYDDITERKRAEEVLRQSEEKYRTIIKTIQEGYFETDLAGNFTFVNDKACKDLGYTKEELIGMNNRAYTSPETAKKIYEIFNAIYKEGKSIKAFDYEAIRKDGTIITLELSASLMRDPEGKPIGFRGVSRDITERKQMEEALRQNEEKYRTILNSIQEGYFEFDLAGKITFINDTLWKRLGYSKEELLGHTNKVFTDEATRKESFRAFNELYKTGVPVKALTQKNIRKDGSIRISELSVSLMRDSGGKPIGFFGTSRDVTERNQMEEVLRQSEEKYRSIIETMQDGYFEADLKGRYTFANEALRRRQGYSKDELIGMSNREFQNETNAKKAYQAFHEVYRTGEPIKALEMEVIKKDGTRGFSELSVSLIRDAQGKPIGFRGISHDVTERKQMEETLRQSEEKYRTILENMQEGYFELDLTGHMTFVNDPVCRHLGYTKEELIGAGYRQLQDETTAEKMNEIYKEVHRTGKSVKAVETEYNRKDGTKGDYEISVSLIRDAQGKPIGFRGVSRDVTERKQIEEALRQSEEQYRTIIETMQEGYFEIDLKGSYTFANEALCKRQGYSKEELIGMNNRQFQDETNAQKTYQAFHEVYRTGEPNKSLEMETIGKDGTKRISEVSVSVIRDAQGKPIGFRGISHDVTERKQMEEALRQSEERYRTIVETMYDGYFEVDLAGNFTFVNDAQCRMTGSSKERLIGRNNREYTTKEEAKKLYEVFSGVYKTGEPAKELAFEFIKKDGTKAFNEISVFLIRDAQGKSIGFRGMSRDVTERKLAEEALRQSEEKYRNILENMQEGYTELDLKGNWTLVNDKVVRDLGHTKEELIGTNSRQYRDGKNEEKIYQAYNELYKTGETIRALEVVYVSKNGIERTYELTASLIRDEQGKPIGFRAVSRDITERKKAEEQLKRYAAELERSNEEVKNFAYIVSHDLRVPLVNLKGYTSELRTALEVIGSNFDAALPHLIDEKRSEVAMALHEDVPEALEFITNSVSRMDSFINSILILSRLGRQDLKPEPIDMNALVQTTVETMSHQIQERGIEVIVGSLPHVVADRTSMEQIIGNILSNAVKYPDSSRPCRIEVAAEANNGETIFTIQDTGRGIAQEDMHKVFAPFRRAGKQDTQGEGMGLAYVQTLVHRHGGRIWCESSLGKGTTFTFTIATTFKQGASDV